MQKIVIALFFILFTACVAPLRAQHKQMEQFVGWYGNHIELHTISDKAKQQSCSFIVNDDSIRALVLNNQARVLQQFTLPIISGEKVLGGFFKNGQVYLFTEKRKNDELHIWMLDIATGKTAEKKQDFDLKKEETVDRISCGDRFLYFTVDKKMSEFIIYNFTNEVDYTTLRYKFGEGVWNDLTSGFLFRSIDVEKVDVEGTCSMEVAQNPNKLYVQNDTLFLVMNSHKDSTSIYGFDLLNNKVATRTISHRTGMSLSDESSSENSFLLHGKLYYVRATFDSLHIQVLNFHTGQLLKTYSAGKDDEIAFKNTPIVQEGSVTFANTVRELKTKQFLRKLVNGDAIITATQTGNNRVEIVVAMYKKITKRNDGRWVGGPPGSPQMYVPSNNFTRNSWTKSTRFKMLLQADTFEFIDGMAGRSINDRIETYTADLKNEPEAENLFMSNGQYYYAYYDKEERKMVVLKF